MSEQLSEPVPGREWQAEFPFGRGSWLPVVGMTYGEVLLAGDHVFRWHGTADEKPSPNVHLRYRVPVRGQPMAWRPGGPELLPLLAQDMGLPELMETIRAAML